MRTRTMLTIAFAALAPAAAGCGGREQNLVDRALSHPIRDADISLATSLTNGGSKVFDLTVSGPYHANGPSELDSFDLRIGTAYTVAGSARQLAFRVISTGTDVWVQHGGKTYEVGRAAIARLNRQAASAHAKRPQPRSIGDLKHLGIDLQQWFPDSHVVGDETLRGERVTHLDGRLDVSAALQNVAHLLDRPSFRRAMGARGVSLTPAIISRIDRLTTDPHLDVYVSKADGGFRAIAARLGIRTPGLGKDPISTLAMRLEFSDVGHAEAVSAPSGPSRPIRALLPALQRELGGGAASHGPAANAAA